MRVPGHLVLLFLGSCCFGIHTRSSGWTGAMVWALASSSNPSKREASFFSVDPHEANLQPHLFLFNSALRFNPLSLLLGSYLTNSFLFCTCIWVFPSSQDLRLYSAFPWVLSKELLYKAFLRILLSYPSPRWLLFLSVNKLLRLHQTAICAITGCLSLSSNPLLLSEVSSLPVTLTYLTLLSYKRVLHLSTSFSISSLARLRVKANYQGPPKESLRHTFSFYPRKTLYACLLLGAHLPSAWSLFIYSLVTLQSNSFSIGCGSLPPCMTLSLLTIWWFEQ